MVEQDRNDRGIPSLSRRMTGLRYRDYRLVLGAALLILGLSALLAGLLLDSEVRQRYGEECKNPVLFDSGSPGEYSYVRLQYMTDRFAEHIKTEQDYYFGFDSMFRPYIISVKGGLGGELTALMEYTYGNGTEEPPPPVDVYGYAAPIGSELLGYARESYSLMWEETQLPVTMEELTQIVGKQYLDTVPRTYREQYPWTLLFYAVPGIILAAGGSFLFSYIRRLKAQAGRLAGREEELLAADRELASAGEYVKGSRIYLTEHFAISASCQFEVVPYSRISRVVCGGGLVIAVTEDERAHIVAGAGRCRGFANMLAAELERRIPPVAPVADRPLSDAPSGR